MPLQIFLPVFGLVAFLLGIRLMSTSLQQLAGSRLQAILARLTRTPLRGTIVGTIVAAGIQSSSATTVIVVAAVNGGLLSLKQALSLIVGANVGTTITAQIASLQLYQLIVPTLILGTLLLLLPPSRQLGWVLLGLSLLFAGMQLMTDNLALILHLPWVCRLLTACSRSPALGVVVGTLITALVQSSSAVTAVVIGLAAAQALDLSAATGLILGSNIGTCVTALLAAWGASRPARQAAWAHMWFNVMGVLAVMPFYDSFLHLVADTAPDVVRQIANGHTLFNLFSALIFLLFITPISSSLEKMQ